MEAKDHPIWKVETGDKFTREKGMPDIWEVVEIEEQKGFGTPVRKVTFAATEYSGSAAPVKVRTDSDGKCPEFQRDFEEVEK